jgi:DNA-binding TFAR19-related protein (PDSD5 family)
MRGITHVVVFAVALAVAGAGLATAGQQRPHRVSDQQLKDLVNRIDTHEQAFRSSFKRAIDRSPIKNSQAADQAGRSMKDFNEAADQLRDRVNDGQSVTSDTENLLRRASAIDSLMTRTQFEAPAQRDWQALRLDMNDLTRAYGIAWNWSAASQTVPARVNDNQIKRLLKTIGQKADRFDKGLDRAFANSTSDAGQGKDEIRRAVKDLKQATDRLRDRVNGRQVNTLDADEVLRRGASIDGFMQRYQLSTQAEQNWVLLRCDLDKLASAYNVRGGWSDSGYPSSSAGFQQRLTGTYQLDAGRSDDPRRTAEQASRAAATDQRQRTYQNLLSRLESPEMIAIERRGSSVSMASTHGPQVNFEVDGRNQAETWSGGRTINTLVTFEGERLRVATTGDRRSDYIATFEPTDNGRGLLVTRTIYDEGLRQPVTARSAYRRTSDQPRWNFGNGNGGYDPTTSPRGGLAVPDGTRFVARLDNDLRTSDARQGDRWTMTAVSPSQYAGAVVQGYVSSVNAPGRPAGSSDMTLVMENIRFRNGDASPFEGVIESMRTPNGDTIRVDRDGTIETPGDGDDSRTRQAVERGALGAALGALIGASVGGGKGALIGGAVGASVGAGTVIVQGRDRFDLQRGTELTFTSGDPRYR